jgi:protein EFR3
LQIDPYLRIGDDLQLYVRLQSDLGSYGSESDQEVARSILSDSSTKVGLHDQQVLDVIASSLFSFTKVSFDLPCVYC